MQDRTEMPWCCLCGQRHAMRTACDPERMRQVEEWRARMASVRCDWATPDWSRIKAERLTK
jgi:hypothetical protein